MILLAITPGLGFDRESWRAVLRSGVDGFLLREKELSARALLDAVRWSQDTAPGVRLWVAGRLDVALAAGCGLHAPEAYPAIEAGLVPLSRPLHQEDQWPARSGASCRAPRGSSRSPRNWPGAWRRATASVGRWR